MRSTTFVPLLFSSLALVAFAPGCTSGTLSAFAGDESGGDPTGLEAREETNRPPPASVKSFVGSPLCRVKPDGTDAGAGSCNPDEPPNRKDNGCAQVINDPRACRIQRTGSEVEPACVPTSTGIEGDACTKGEDCAAGFDCIDGPGGGTCRHYCCGGRCDTHLSTNGGATFCDIQQLFELNPLKAPVCMPIKACYLMQAGQCADTETCAIVTDDGDTGCVANGAARAGQSCDEEHCNTGLTCIGLPGSRKCYQLCRVDGSGGQSACGSQQVCKTASFFKDQTFGLCKTL